MESTLFRNAWVVTMDSRIEQPPLREASVGVADGRIVCVTKSESEVARFCQQYGPTRTIDCRGKVVMPGLINTHCHAGMTLQRNSADDIPLMSWLNDRIWPFEKRQTAQDIALATRLGVVELLLGGVTSVVEMYFEADTTVEVFKELGMRALVGTNCFEDTVDSAFATIERAKEHCKGQSLVQLALAPHAPYTVSPDQLSRCRDYAEEHNLPLMIHLAETQDELKQIEERYGCRPVELLDRVGLLTSGTIVAHCVHLTEEEVALLAERGVVVAHCPQCNMKISSGVAPIAALNKAGACVTLATDGPASNNDLDMWEEMRTAAFLQKVSTQNPLSLPAYEVLRMATVEGARALGLAGELGVIREGALADLIVVDMQRPHLQPLNDVVAALVYSAKSSDVEMVMVDGRMLVEEHRVVGVDLERLFEVVNRRALELGGATHE